MERLHQLCGRKFELARRRGVVYDREAAWFGSPANGQQVSLMSCDPSSYRLEGLNPFMRRARTVMWVQSDGVQGPNDKPITEVPGHIIQTLTDALPYPLPGEVYRVFGPKSKTVALLRLWVRESDRTLRAVLYTLFGEDKPDVLSTVCGKPYLDPAKWWRLSDRSMTDCCTDRIRASSQPVLWHNGDQYGHGSYIIVRDSWTGISGPGLYVQSIKRVSGITPELALKIGGQDIRTNFRR